MIDEQKREERKQKRRGGGERTKTWMFDLCEVLFKLHQEAEKSNSLAVSGQEGDEDEREEPHLSCFYTSRKQ